MKPGLKLLSFLGFAVLALTLAGCSAGAGPPRALPDTLDGTVLHVTRELADGRPQVLWEALPASYQSDLTSLVHEAASRVDAEVWNRTFATLDKATRLLEQKRDFILSHPMVAANMPDRGEAEKNWDGLVRVLEIVVRSDLADLERVRTLDLESFLAGTGAQLMGQFAELSALTPDNAWATGMDKLRETKVTLLSSSEDSGRVRIEVPGSPAQEQAFVRVEGRWVPRAMADTWDETMTEARRAIEEMSVGLMQEKKPALLAQLGMADALLDSLLRAETESEFHAGLGSMMGMAFSAMAAQAQTAGRDAASMPSVSIPSAPAPASEPAPSPVGDDSKPDWYPPESITAGNAESFVGSTVRVVTENGLDVTGTLAGVRDGKLVIERIVSGGSVTVKISPDEIASLRPAL
jgi:hypothetical protein